MAGLFEKRRRSREIEREVKFRQGLNRVRAYIERCRQIQKRYWELGKRALKTGDRKQFENLARALVRTGDVVARWERYLIAMETVSVERDQVKATGEFAKSMRALSASMMASARPEDITSMQKELEQALANARTLDETLAAVMDASSETIFSTEGLSEEALRQIEAEMKGEAVHEEETVLDERIARGLRSIEEEMKKEIR